MAVNLDALTTEVNTAIALIKEAATDKAALTQAQADLAAAQTAIDTLTAGLKAAQGTETSGTAG